MTNSIALYIKETAEIDTFTALKYTLFCGKLEFSSGEKVIVSFEDDSKIQIIGINKFKTLVFEVIDE